MPRIKKLLVSKILTDEVISSKEGTWFTEDDLVHPVIRSNIDVYYLNELGQETLLLKYRKNQISDELCDLGWNSYRTLAKPSRGRGASAGPIHQEGQYFGKRSLVHTKKWSTGYLKPEGKLLKEDLDLKSLEDIKDKAKELKVEVKDDDTKDIIIYNIVKATNGVSSMKINNQVASNPIGFYEESKNFAKLPCRLTHFTRVNYDKYQEGLPFIQKINQCFKKLIPEAHKKQLCKASEKPHLKIPKTCFSTITINRNFRTALHRDAGDFKEGFGNLTVIERGKYHGGYTCLPQFGIGIDVRRGDFLAMDVHEWHTNTPIYETEEDKVFNATLEDIFQDNPEVGTVGIYEKYTRLTFVCYLREKISKCPDQKDLTENDLAHLTKSGHSKIKHSKIEIK
jgi:hypothetical protein